MKEYGNMISVVSKTPDFPEAQTHSTRALLEYSYKLTKEQHPEWGLTTPTRFVETEPRPVFYTSDVLIGSERDGEILCWEKCFGWYEAVED